MPLNPDEFNKELEGLPEADKFEYKNYWLTIVYNKDVEWEIDKLLKDLDYGISHYFQPESPNLTGVVTTFDMDDDKLAMIEAADGVVSVEVDE